MRHGCLRYAAAAMFLALGAYMIAAFAEKALSPATVTARLSTVTETLYAEGRILLDEVSLDLPAGAEEFTVPAGARVRAGTVLFCGENGEVFAAPCAGFFAGDRIVRNGWSFEAELEDSGSLYEGRSLTLVIAEKEYPATVTELDGSRVILRCRQGLCDMLDVQTAEAELKLGSVTGIKLPPGAVGEDENGFFVTVLKAGSEKKQHIHIIYDKNNCILADPSDIGEGVRIVTASPQG